MCVRVCVCVFMLLLFERQFYSSCVVLLNVGEEGVKDVSSASVEQGAEERVVMWLMGWLQ